MNLVFVIQRGELELKALLLAWSLRESHGKSLTLFAACPEHADWDQLQPGTLAALQRLDVTLLKFQPHFAPDYPIGNKIGLLGLLPEGQPGMFVDSDILSLQRWSVEDLLAGAAAAAKPADCATWGDEQRWSEVYALAGQALPQRRVHLTVSGQLSLPYFNAGLVAAREPAGLGADWLQLAQLLRECSLDLGQRYPWLDQIALPLAMARQPAWRALDERWNYPAHLRALGDTEINLCHYHQPGVILREPRLRRLFQRACRQQPHIAALAAEHPGWQPLLAGQGAPWLRKGKRRDFLITGVPRSGTSYICQLLDQQRNWLVINEPAEIFGLLDQRPDASGLALLHRQLREQIYRGEPVANKVENGRVVSDTALRDERQLYHPPLQGSDFWLGSKNTLAYMAALKRIRGLGWPVLASVRHPLDTLASWRNTFSHLREAQVTQLPVANPAFAAWSGEQRQALLEITNQSDAAVRRVLLWRLLARALLDNADWLTLWRYEDLTADPAAHVRRFNRQLGYRAWVPRLQGRSRQRGSQCDELERALLGDLCAVELRELDYEL